MAFRGHSSGFAVIWASRQHQNRTEPIEFITRWGGHVPTATRVVASVGASVPIPHGLTDRAPPSVKITVEAKSGVYSYLLHAPRGLEISEWPQVLDGIDELVTGWLAEKP